MTSHPSAMEMTREEFSTLKNELEYLRTVKREQVSEKIRVARGFGDLSENSEYDEAKNDQAQLESRIGRIEEQLKHVSIVEEVSTDSVAIGTKVVLLDMSYGDETEYRIVSSAGSSDDGHTITTGSPVGKAILGKRAGQEAIVKAPAGEIQFKIVSISK
ncbi:MAG: transcription elongation factor GreA [Oscillospiraceae bacterium]